MKFNFLKRIRPKRGVATQCDQCKKMFDFEKCLVERPRPEGSREQQQVIEVGLLCPHCAHFTLSYRTNRDLERAKKRLTEAAEQFRFMKTDAAEQRYRQLKADVAEIHDRLNPDEAR